MLSMLLFTSIMLLTMLILLILLMMRMLLITFGKLLLDYGDDVDVVGVGLCT